MNLNPEWQEISPGTLQRKSIGIFGQPVTEEIEGTYRRRRELFPSQDGLTILRVWEGHGDYLAHNSGFSILFANQKTNSVINIEYTGTKVGEPSQPLVLMFRQKQALEQISGFSVERIWVYPPGMAKVMMSYEEDKLDNVTILPQDPAEVGPRITRPGAWQKDLANILDIVITTDTDPDINGKFRARIEEQIDFRRPNFTQEGLSLVAGFAEQVLDHIKGTIGNEQWKILEDKMNQSGFKDFIPWDLLESESDAIPEINDALVNRLLGAFVSVFELVLDDFDPRPGFFYSGLMLSRFQGESFRHRVVHGESGSLFRPFFELEGEYSNHDYALPLNHEGNQIVVERQDDTVMVDVFPKGSNRWSLKFGLNPAISVALALDLLKKIDTDPRLIKDLLELESAFN